MRSLSALLLLCLFVAACGGGGEDASIGLPLVDAPLDTVNVIETRAEVQDSGVVETSVDVDLSAPEWLSAELPGYPPPKELVYTRYTNAPYRYSFAYPDSLFGEVQPIGEGRGMEFATRDSTARMMAYAIEGSSQDDFEELYQDALTQPEARVAYRARESTWYIVAGRLNEHVFYEKSILSGGVLKTLRIEYPVAQRDYFDAVAAVMSASLK